VHEVAARLSFASMRGRRGIVQLRWATFGAPSRANAQPHLDSDGDLVGAHNGNVVNAETKPLGEIEVVRTGMEIDCKYENFSNGKQTREQDISAKRIFKKTGSDSSAFREAFCSFD